MNIQEIHFVNKEGKHVLKELTCGVCYTKFKLCLNSTYLFDDCILHTLAVKVLQTYQVFMSSINTRQATV